MKRAAFAAGSIAVIVAAVFCVTPLLAVSGGAQAYASKTPIESGRVVILENADTQHVRIAKKDDAKNMFGISVDGKQLPLTLSTGSLENEVYVAVSGTFPALVSTEGGAIASGDHLMLSAIDGVLMKAENEKTTVFGRANESFDGKSGVTLGTTTLTDSEGGKRTVSLGSVPVTIDIKRNPNEKTTKAKVPEVLERIGQAIAEKEVSAIRIYLSMAITAISLIAAIAVIYGGVRNSIISIGRNPMSRKSIFRALAEVIITSILILIIGLFAVYLLLKL